MIKKIRWDATINLGHICIVMSFLVSGIIHLVAFSYRMDNAEKTLVRHEERIQKVEAAEVTSSITSARMGVLIDELQHHKVYMMKP